MCHVDALLNRLTGDGLDHVSREFVGEIFPNVVFQMVTVEGASID
jgi:hypothetical protein